MREFSINYSAYNQRRFLDLVKEDRISDAVSVLEEMPRGLNAEEEACRVKVILEGYRFITSNFSYLSPDMVEELGRYRELGTVEELKSLTIAQKILESI